MNSAPENSPKQTYRLMAGVAVAAIVLIGVVIYSLSQISGTAMDTPQLPVPTITATLRQDLPHFEYSNEGKSLKAQNFEGKWTLLTFWADWCAPCLDEMPALNQLAQQWQGPEFEVLTINVDDPHSENFEAAKKFLSDQGIVLPTLFDRDGDLKKAFGVTDLPRHFLINPQQKIVWQERGAFQWTNPKVRDQLMKVIEDSTEDDDSTTEPDQDSPAGSAK